MICLTDDSSLIPCRYTLMGLLRFMITSSHNVDLLIGQKDGY